MKAEGGRRKKMGLAAGWIIQTSRRSRPTQFILHPSAMKAGNGALNIRNSCGEQALHSRWLQHHSRALPETGRRIRSAWWTEHSAAP